MITTDVTFPGTSGLSELETFVDQEEEVLGPLVNLGNAGPNSVLTFDMSSPPPKQFVILRTTPGGATPVVAGFTLVCQGNCLVGGQLTGVAALRSDAEKPSIPSVKPGSAVEQALTGELPAALAFKDLIVQAAAAKNLPPAIIAAIGSVESGWGTSTLMQPNGPTGTGDRAPRPPKPPLRPGSMPTDGLGFGRGLMQIDWDSHEFARTGNWQDAAANIAFACELFASNRDRFAAESGIDSADAITAAIAAYNLGFDGASRLIETEGLKAAFASNSYATKVLGRVEFFRSNGFDAGAAFQVAAAPGAGPFIAPSPENLLGTSVPDGQCVAYVRNAAGAPNTITWRQGDLVKGNAAVKKGTAIATFDPNGRYGNHTDGRSHAAIYLGQDAAGLNVLDQWASPQVQPVHQRHIRFGGSTPVNDGDAFFVIV
jgi:Transglycosylase SLT domain